MFDVKYGMEKENFEGEIEWMKKWFGSAGVCVNENGQILMVKQGRPEERKLWSVPSGGVELVESFDKWR